MYIQLKPLQCITDASERYDYVWAKTIIDNLYIDKEGKKTYRLVENADEWHFKQQMMRYGSGGHISIDDQTHLDDFLRNGWLVPTDSPVHIYRQRIELKDFHNWTEDKIELVSVVLDKLREAADVKVESLDGGLAYNIEARGDDAQKAVIDADLHRFTS